MNTKMHGKQIDAIYWPDTEDGQERHSKSGPGVLFELSATHHGDHDEFWIIEERKIDGEYREVARHNPRFVETIVWMEV